MDGVEARRHVAPADGRAGRGARRADGSDERRRARLGARRPPAGEQQRRGRRSVRRPHVRQGRGGARHARGVARRGAVPRRRAHLFEGARVRHGHRGRPLRGARGELEQGRLVGRSHVPRRAGRAARARGARVREGPRRARHAHAAPLSPAGARRPRPGRLPARTGRRALEDPALRRVRRREDARLRHARRGVRRGLARHEALPGMDLSERARGRVFPRRALARAPRRRGGRARRARRPRAHRPRERRVGPRAERRPHERRAARSPLVLAQRTEPPRRRAGDLRAPARRRRARRPVAAARVPGVRVGDPRSDGARGRVGAAPARERRHEAPAEERAGRIRRARRGPFDRGAGRSPRRELPQGSALRRRRHRRDRAPRVDAARGRHALHRARRRADMRRAPTPSKIASSP